MVIHGYHVFLCAGASLDRFEVGFEDLLWTYKFITAAKPLTNSQVSSSRLKNSKRNTI